MHKIKPGTLTARTVKNNFKGTIDKLWQVTMHFVFMSSVKGAPAYCKRFLYDVLAMVKQLGTLTYFLTLSCPGLRWEEPPYIIKKSSNFRLSKSK